MPILEKLIKKGIDLTNVVFERLLCAYKDSGSSVNAWDRCNRSTSSILKLVLLAMKKKKLDGSNSDSGCELLCGAEPTKQLHESSILSPESSSTVQYEILTAALFNFEDEIRNKGGLSIKNYIIRFDLMVAVLGNLVL